jgi:hypothetical protein
MARISSAVAVQMNGSASAFQSLGAGDVGGHLATRLVRQTRLRWRRRPGRRQDPGPDLSRDLLPSATPFVVPQPGQPELGVPVHPSVHGVQRHPGQPGHVFAHSAFGHPAHDLCPRCQHGRDVSAADHGPELGALILLRHHPAGIDQRRQVKANPTSTWRYRITQEDKAVLTRGDDVRPLVTARLVGRSGRTPAETAQRH